MGELMKAGKGLRKERREGVLTQPQHLQFRLRLEYLGWQGGECVGGEVEQREGRVECQAGVHLGELVVFQDKLLDARVEGDGHDLEISVETGHCQGVIITAAAKRTRGEAGGAEEKNEQQEKVLHAPFSDPASQGSSLFRLLLLLVPASTLIFTLVTSFVGHSHV